jgi:hypothetical protein
MLWITNDWSLENPKANKWQSKRQEHCTTIEKVICSGLKLPTVMISEPMQMTCY